jgi:hypothetical protein
MVFKFMDKALMQKWINLYIDIKENIGKEPSQKELK